MIDRGDIGEITSLIFRRVGGFPPRIKDADIVVDLAIHDIDIAHYLLGELSHKVVLHRKKNYVKKRADSVELFMTFPTASVFIQANWVTPIKIRKINVTGTKGYLELDYITQKIEFYKSNYERFSETSGTFSDFIVVFSEPDRLDISVARKEPLKEELSYFVSCVQNATPIDSTFALNASKIALTK
jgi:UDP-N-acetylglucosamine 3-dehydrogenase